jgi:hypothetical protein
VKVVEMSAMHCISQGRILIGCDDLLDFEGHVGHGRYDKLQCRDVLIKPGLGNARGMVDVVGAAYATNPFPVVMAEGTKQLFTCKTR